MYIIQYNKYCFYTGIISGIDTSHKIYKLLTGLVSIAVCIHLIICIIVNTKCIENSFYFLCFFYLGLCGTPWWTAICLFAAIGPFSSWYNSMESGGVLYLNSSILFFLIRIQDSAFTQYRLWIPPLYTMFYQDILYLSMTDTLYQLLFFHYVSCKYT